MTPQPTLAKRVCARPGRSLAGVLRPPGDKSISHRALILGALAEGATTITHLLESEDVLRTVDAMRALGAEATRADNGLWTVSGVGARGFSQPAGPLDFGNSGTGCRLTMGAVAGWPIEAEFDGDASLRSRPMERVLEPLRAMGAAAWCDDDRLPVTIKGKRPLRATSWISARASAQVKSAVLLAALSADGPVEFVEPKASRDHTERMLGAFGVRVETESDHAAHWRLIEGPAQLRATGVDVPADPSSAAFVIAAAIVTPDSRVTVDDVMINPTRSGFLETLFEMGVELDVEETAAIAPEPTANITAATSATRGVEIPPERAASMIDEFPILAVAAAFAEGETTVRGAEELRVKESDRITAIVDMLRVNGVTAGELEDGFTVHGMGRDGVPGGGVVETRGDHRIAMSALIMGLAARRPVAIDDATMIATSYPKFIDDMRALGADIEADAP